MASLTGNTVASTYKSLLKTVDNDIVSSSLKTITDGLGNPTAISLDIDSVVVSGSLTISGSLLYSGSTIDATVTSAISASYALTASYALNGGGGGNVDTSSLATTGSNIFIGNQTITGSLTVTGGIKGTFLRNETNPTVPNIIRSNESIFNPTNLRILSTDAFIIEENAEYYVLGDVYNSGSLIVSGTMIIDGILYNSGSITGPGIII